MKIKTFESRYELLEFYYYIDNSDTKQCISVIELLIKTNDFEFLELELSNIFAVEVPEFTYTFSGYEVLECYEVDSGLVKVICVK